MFALAVDLHPDWFDWLTLVVTVLAAVCLHFWRLPSGGRTGRPRSWRAANPPPAEFTQLLATGDRVLVRFRDFGHFADAMGPGATALLALVNQFMEWDHEIHTGGVRRGCFLPRNGGVRDVSLSHELGLRPLPSCRFKPLMRHASPVSCRTAE